MNQTVVDKRERRLNGLHARQRLGIERDHETQIFEQGTNSFHVENWYSIRAVIRTTLKLFRAMRAMDDAGFMPGITSAFRDDYRQSIASGNKAASDSSFHGGSRRGGYGHGLAVDLVSVKGKTRLQRFAVSEELWKWIDAHEKELGVGRPYRDRDPPHVGPIDGKEYVAKRGLPIVRKAGL